MHIHATRAAVEEGIVAGGGVALIRAASKVVGLEGDNEEQNVGIRVALRAMESPIRQITKNAGDEESVVANNVRAGEGNYGYNAATGEYGDMIAMGILDPTKSNPFCTSVRCIGCWSYDHNRSNDNRQATRFCSNA